MTEAEADMSQEVLKHSVMLPGKLPENGASEFVWIRVYPGRLCICLFGMMTGAIMSADQGCPGMYHSGPTLGPARAGLG